MMRLKDAFLGSFSTCLDSVLHGLLDRKMSLPLYARGLLTNKSIGELKRETCPSSQGSTHLLLYLRDNDCTGRTIFLDHYQRQ